jgi:hypothetical protein
MPVEPPVTAPAPPERPPENVTPEPVSARSRAPRWLVILAWSTGPAAVYALLSLAQAALVEGILSVDVGFGRSLAFWIVAIYLALPLWGFLPARPTGWYAGRRLVLGLLVLGTAGLVVSGAFTALWLPAHWVPSIGGPVTASIAVLVVAAVGVLWLAGRDEPQTAQRRTAGEPSPPSPGEARSPSPSPVRGGGEQRPDRQTPPLPR